jgi:hypothetical protein
MSHTGPASFCSEARMTRAFWDSSIIYKLGYDAPILTHLHMRTDMVVVFAVGIDSIAGSIVHEYKLK